VQRTITPRSSSLERIFVAGLRRIRKIEKATQCRCKSVMDARRRAMRATYQREMDSWSTLGISGRGRLVSPYVGLFGTVLGHHECISRLANVGQATLAHVAPALQKHWSPPRWACLPRFLRWCPITAMP